MNEKCEKWHEQLKTLREKHAEFLQTYADALKFAEQNPKVRDTAFQECRKQFNEIKPLVMELQKDFGPAFKYKQIVKRLTLSPYASENFKLQEKLLEMVSKENYNEAVTTAKELDSNVKVPTREEIIKNLLALGPEKLEKIATVMGKPGLIIVPDKSMEEIKDAMNVKRHYDSQNEAVFAEDYVWSGNPGKVSVSIVDMVQYPPRVPGQKPGEQCNDEQIRVCEKYFSDNGMHLISDTQYAAGMQKSLRAYEKANKDGDTYPERHILDYYGKPQKTGTYFNQKDKIGQSQVSIGFFSPRNSQCNFDWSRPYTEGNFLRGRGAVQVM